MEIYVVTYNFSTKLVKLSLLNIHEKEKNREGMYMEIIMQTIRIIDYENNKVVNRDIPDAFSDYVRQLIAYNEKD